MGPGGRMRFKLVGRLSRRPRPRRARQPSRRQQNPRPPRHHPSPPHSDTHTKRALTNELNSSSRPTRTHTPRAARIGHAWNESRQPTSNTCLIVRAPARAPRDLPTPRRAFPGGYQDLTPPSTASDGLKVGRPRARGAASGTSRAVAFFEGSSTSATLARATAPPRRRAYPSTVQQCGPATAAARG